MIHEFNLALLSKQLWRLLQSLDSLIARVLRRKYFRCSMPLRLNKADRPSYGWTSIMAAMIPARPTRPIALVVHPMMPVRYLMIGSPKRWNLEMLENYVSPEDILLIQSLAISQGYHRDKYCWSYTKNVMYTIMSG